MDIRKIDFYWDVEGLGAIGHADEAASYLKFEEMVEEALKSAYPEAVVSVRQHSTANGGFLAVETADDCYRTDRGGAQECEDVRRVIDRIWEQGAWIVGFAESEDDAEADF